MSNYQAVSPAKSGSSLNVSQIKPSEDHFTFESHAHSQSMSRASFRMKSEQYDTDSQSDHRFKV